MTPATPQDPPHGRPGSTWPGDPLKGSDYGSGSRHHPAALTPQPVSPPRASLAGTRLGPYEIRHELARGGMGVVYRAYHPGLDREVALKVLRAGAYATPAQQERLRIEARAAAKLRHPNIVSVYDVGCLGGVSYLVLDLVEGETLEASLARGGPLPCCEAAEVVLQLASALEAAHAEGILHRDVKPANVLLDSGGRPLLTDFGLAKDLSVKQGVSVDGGALGTPGYLPPEQALGDLAAMGPHSDVYALGATLYELLCGRPPFSELSPEQALAAAVHEQPRPPRRLRPEIPRDLQVICLRCLEKEPGQRYPSARALADDLRRFLAGDSLEGRARTSIRSRILVGLGCVLLVGGGLVGLRAALEPSPTPSPTPTPVDSAARAEVEDLLDRALAGALSTPSSRLEAAARIAARGAWVAPRMVRVLEAVEAAWEGGATLPMGQLQQAEVACRVLAMGEPYPLARGALEDYLERENDPTRAAEAGLALARVHGEEALPLLRELARRHGAHFAQRVRQALPELASGDGGRLAEHARRAEESFTAGEFEASLREAAKGLELGEHAGLLVIQARARVKLLVSPANLGASLSDLDRAISLKPKLATAWVLRGRLRAKQGQVELALSDLAQALVLEPEIGDHHFHLGTILINADRPREALVPLRRAVALDPDHGLVHNNLGVALLKLDDFAGSEAALSTHLARSPRDASAWANRAYVREQLNKFREGIEDANRALELEPRHVAALTHRGVIHTAQGRLEAAKRDLDRALELDPKSGVAWFHRGRLYVHQKRWVDAIAELQKASLYVPNRVQVWNNLGLCYTNTNDRRRALAAFSRAVQVAPRHAASWCNRANTYQRLGKHRLALADLERACALAPTDTNAFFSRGNIRKALGDEEGALADYAQAERLSPTTASIPFNRGRLHRAARRYAQAIRDFDRAIALDPSVPRFFSNRGATRMEQGKLEQALPDFTHAIKLVPRGPLHWNNRGLLYHRLGRMKEALADFDQALAVAPLAVLPRANRGFARAKTGNRAGARADLLRFLELAPNHEQAHEVRAKLAELR